MKVNGNNLKAGMIVSHKGGMWKVISTQSVKPGKGGAFAQVELKNLKDSSKLNERFRSSEVVERLYVETKSFQYSYNDGDTYHFMDTDTYEQISLDKNIKNLKKPNDLNKLLLMFILKNRLIRKINQIKIKIKKYLFLR